MPTLSVTLPEGVLPTCVGMVPQCIGSCGDGVEFSPRAWGWSAIGAAAAILVAVLPTCVGMVRLRADPTSPDQCSPHVRGDGPDA